MTEEQINRVTKVLTLAVEALNTSKKFKVGETDSYAIAVECTKVLSEVVGSRHA